MTNAYVAVQWNVHKRFYDRLLWSFVGLYLVSFVVAGMLLYPVPEEISPPVLVIRATGTLAFLLLHVVLAAGPLARLSARWNALLYNRRHLGVTTFLVGLLHALAVLGFYGGFGIEGPLQALFAGYSWDGSLSGFPFELLGLLGLAVMFLMAATSHDFWLANLGSGFWKALHLLVVLAYAALVGHVALGAMQSEHGAPWPWLLLLGAGGLTSLHLIAAWRTLRAEKLAEVAVRARGTTIVPAGLSHADGPPGGWLNLGPVEDIAMDRAKTVPLPQGGAAAVYRWEGGVHAVASVCSHQGGPLQEGKVVEGCITCPWHGYQYLPDTGASPPPYEEQLDTYPVRIEDGMVLLDPRPCAREVRS